MSEKHKSIFHAIFQMAKEMDNEITATLDSEIDKTSDVKSVSRYPEFYTVDAYHPCDHGSSAGHTHIETRDAIQLGRIKREPGQILCSKKKHWQRLPNSTPVTCHKCYEIAKRYSLDIGKFHTGYETDQAWDSWITRKNK